MILRPIAVLLFTLSLVGCGSNAKLMTAPGAEFPAAVDVCVGGHDALDRCKRWKYGSGEYRPLDS